MILFQNQNNQLERLATFASPCRICPRKCGVDRPNGERGQCLAGYHPHIAAFGISLNEESVISGTRGSGQITFSGCNMKCLYCENHDISQSLSGHVKEPEALADMMLKLASDGVHNINLTTPTHNAPSIAQAVATAKQKGLNIPVVYNCGGYESPDTIRLLGDVIDIYLVDIKYGIDALAAEFSEAPDYTFYAKSSLKEMYRQKGDLAIENGVATSGVLVRHLVLPDSLQNTAEALKLIRSCTTGRVHINLMSQFAPVYRSMADGRLTRTIQNIEYEVARDNAKKFGFVLLQQEKR